MSDKKHDHRADIDKGRFTTHGKTPFAKQPAGHTPPVRRKHYTRQEAEQAYTEQRRKAGQE